MLQEAKNFPHWIWTTLTYSSIKGTDKGQKLQQKKNCWKSILRYAGDASQNIGGYEY